MAAEGAENARAPEAPAAPEELPSRRMRSFGQRLQARCALLRRSPRLALPLLIRGVFETLIRLTPGGRRTFADPRAHAWTAALEAGFPAIRAELDAVLAAWERIPAFQEIQPEQAALTQDERWKTYVFYGYGAWVDANRAECPQTSALLEQVPGLRAAMFSILAPGKQIPPHRGPYAGVLRYHLGLRVPDPARCGIRVGRDVAHWAEGQSLLFDDSHDHQAWNDADELRVVLFLDVVRPLPRPLAWLNERFLRALAKSSFVKGGQENLRRWYRAKPQPKAQPEDQPSDPEPSPSSGPNAPRPADESDANASREAAESASREAAESASREAAESTTSDAAGASRDEARSTSVRAA